MNLQTCCHSTCTQTLCKKVASFQSSPEASFDHRSVEDLPSCNQTFFFFSLPYLLLQTRNSVPLGTKLFQDECCTVYGGDDLRFPFDIVPSSSVWKLAKAALAGHYSSVYSLVFLVSDCLYSSFRRISGKLNSFPVLNKQPLLLNMLDSRS